MGNVYKARTIPFRQADVKYDLCIAKFIAL